MITDVDRWLAGPGPYRVLVRHDDGSYEYEEVTKAQAALYAQNDPYWREAGDDLPLCRKMWRALTGRR